MSVLISQLIYIPETHTGVFLPMHLCFGTPRTEVEEEAAYQNIGGPVNVLQ